MEQDREVGGEPGVQAEGLTRDAPWVLDPEVLRRRRVAKRFEMECKMRCAGLLPRGPMDVVGSPSEARCTPEEELNILGAREAMDLGAVLDYIDAELGKK